jgi:hypothetical protein
MLYNDKTKQFLRQLILVFFLAILSSVVFGQVFTNKEVGKKNADLIDSLKKTEVSLFTSYFGCKGYQGRIQFTLLGRRKYSIFLAGIGSDH